MADFDDDTRVHGGDGRWSATVSEDWGIWGPNGGYIASILLRAAGSHSGLVRPASLAVQFLGRADFTDVTLTTRTLRRTRRAEAVAVSMVQGDAAIADGLAWFVADGLDGLEHDMTAMPDVPRPSALRSWDELRAAHDIPAPPFRFWDNLTHWPCKWQADWPPAGPLAPVADNWFRFEPAPTFTDPLVDAGRLVVVLDTMGWPAATYAHAWTWEDAIPPVFAPSLDLHVRFHRFAPDDPFLFSRMESPLATGGLVTSEGRVWSSDGTMLASAGSQMLCTMAPPMFQPG